MKKRIVVEHGTLQKLAKLFNCTPQFCGQCLRYNVKFGKNGIAVKIRNCAVKAFDGVEINCKK
ncbi:MAG: hypothetical protein LBR17_01290 [Bacteroidales bacterium]|jgi:hypothetical protein|nr:hypothetical protein [Bacteroidales bacterium]